MVMDMALFNAVRIGMGVKAAAKVKEEFADWQIAPRYDQQTLREQYVTKQIFNIDDEVENLNTGLVGKIIRRGTNYLIAVTEGNMMFKSWIKDVMEAEPKFVNYSIYNSIWCFFNKKLEQMSIESMLNQWLGQ